MGATVKVLIGLAMIFLMTSMGGFRFVSAHASMFQAERDQPKDFESFSPEQHYLAAIANCKGPRHRPDQYDDDCLLSAPEDFTRVIHHLEAIPDDSQVYGPNAGYPSVSEDAARALQLIRIERDRPQDFESARAVDFQQCFAAKSMNQTTDGCVNGLADMCNLFSAQRAKNRIISAKFREDLR
jgi:hypothetical protein